MDPLPTKGVLLVSVLGVTLDDSLSTDVCSDVRFGGVVAFEV